jgi:methylated-DNA-[protein]-cysteine S-methyltransferase
MIRDLSSAYQPNRDDLDGLHTRLAAAANDAGILDVAYTTMETPVGTLLLAATDLGLIRVAFANEDHATVLQALSDRISARILRAPNRLDPVAKQLEGYFAGRRRQFDLPLDWRLSAGFRRSVLERLGQIGYGQTGTYASLAALAGRPKAVRAVGTACATNPLPIVVPCHRVLRADGALGGYRGGVEAKRTLLTLEAAA